MARSRRRRLSNEPPEFNITTFLNLMVVLVPFLLITAVFSRITILELNMPTGASAQNSSKTKLNVEVIVRKNRLELGDGRKVIARINKLDDGEFDLAKLSDVLVKIKNNYPDKTDATVLLEPDIEYDYLVKVMDVLRSAEIRQGDSEESQTKILFPDISIGDAP